MTAIAGSWIGGAANQAAMKEVFQIEPNVFGMMVAIDVLFAYLWMAVLLWIAANHPRLDRRMNADTSAISRPRAKRWNACASRTNAPRRWPTS